MMNPKLLLVLSAAVALPLSSMASDPIKEEQPEARSSIASTSDRTETQDAITNPNGAGNLAITTQPQVEEMQNVVLSATKDFANNCRQMNYKELKALDQLGSKIAGAHAKTFVEKNVPFGSEITQATGSLAKKIDPNAATLTEVVLNKVRSPLKLPEGDNYPKTKEDLIGDKVKKAVEIIPGGSKVTAITGFIGKTCFGTNTLTAGLVKLCAGSSATQAQPVSANQQPQVVEIEDEEAPVVNTNQTPQVSDIEESNEEKKEPTTEKKS